MPHFAETYHHLFGTLYHELAREHQDAVRVRAEYDGKAERFERLPHYLTGAAYLNRRFFES